MKNFARLSLSLVAVASLAGLAMADDTKTKPTTTTTTTTTKPTTTTTTTTTTTADKPAPMGMPKAPAELATVAKAMKGSWKCTGTSMDMGKGAEAPTKGTIKNKADLDGWWIVTSFAETKKGGFKFTQLTSFDGTKWSRTMFDNMGGKETAESTGMKDQKMVWEGSSTSSMGTMKSRHTEEVKSAKEVHMFGEYSQDGKTNWMKAYDITCKK